MAINESEDGIIAPKTNIPAGMEFRAALAKDDVSRDDGLPAKFLYAKTFAGAVASILDATLTFFVSHKPGLRADGFDFEPGELPAMADRAVVALAALKFEGDNLRRLGLLDDFGGDSGARHERHAYRKAFAVGNQENLLERCLRASLDVEFFDLDHITFRDAVLLAACLNDCVCHDSLSSVRTCENLTPAAAHQAKFFPCVPIPQRQTSHPSFARVVKWQTRTFEGRMPKGMGVQVPPPSTLLISFRDPMGRKRDQNFDHDLLHLSRCGWRMALAPKSK